MCFIRKIDIMRKVLFIVFSLSILSIGCKRFEHKESKITRDCGCCALSDSISGTYTGRLVEYEFAHFSGWVNTNVILDTIVTVSVKRSFEGLNYLEDSLICQFELSHLYDAPIRFTASSIQNGGFYFKNRYYEEFTENGEFIHERDGIFDLGKWGRYPYPLIRFYGEKDE
jgi:hypothetical protein